MTLVLHVTTTDISLALLLGPQLRAFRDAGYEVVTASAPGPYAEELESEGIKHLALRHATRSFHPGRDLAALAELRSLFRSVRPDIVHTHNPKPGIYGRIAARAAAVPAIVNTVHGLYAQPADRLPRRALVYGLERLAASCSHAELVQNPEDLETLRRLGVPDKKLVLLGNGVDLQRFRPERVAGADVAGLRAEIGAGPGELVCLAVGRLVREKGYAELFAAAARLRRTHPAIVFVVAGPADPAKADAMSDEELRQARAVGVRFLGERRDVEVLYAAADLYALASHREGFPRSAMEAAAMGLPIVATDIRGCRQVVEHGMTGLLVPAQEPAALARAIADLATDRGRRLAMAEAARRKAQAEFDDSRVIQTTLELYARLTQRFRVPVPA